MATAEYDVIAEAEKALHVPTHRGPRNEALDKVKSHGTPYQPQHCACLTCVHRFGHVTGVAR